METLKLKQQDVIIPNGLTKAEWIAFFKYLKGFEPKSSQMKWGAAYEIDTFGRPTNQKLRVAIGVTYGECPLTQDQLAKTNHIPGLGVESVEKYKGMGAKEVEEQKAYEIEMLEWVKAQGYANREEYDAAMKQERLDAIKAEKAAIKAAKSVKVVAPKVSTEEVKDMAVEVVASEPIIIELPKINPTSTIASTTMKGKTLKFTQYLSETLVMESITSKPYFKVSLDCPTGGGKSYYILNYLKDNAIPFTFIAPTTFLADQLGKAYSIPVYHAATSKGFDHSTNQVITVQNHIGRFIGDSILIIDEAHTFVSDYGYRSSTIEANLTYGTLFRKVILLSGTPLISGDEFYQGFEKVKAIKTNAIAKTLNLVPYTDWLKATVTLVMESKAKGLTPVVSMLDKSEGLSNLMMALAKEGLTDIATINSVSKDGEQTIESTHYDDLINGNEIKADAIITTYTDGYSMYGTNYSLIIVPSKNRHSYLALVQMMARFRDMDTFDAYLLANVDTTGVFLPNGYEAYSDRLICEATAKAKRSRSDIRKEYRSFRAIDLAFKITPERFNHLTSDLRVNHQKIAYDATTRITNECYANFLIFEQVMNHFNINLTNTMKAIEGTIKKATNKELTKDMSETIEAFIEEVIVDGRKLEGKEDYDLMREWESLVDLGLDQATITKFLKSNYGKPKQEYNKLKLETKMKHSSHPTMVKLRKLTFDAFKVGESLNSDQILERVIPIFTEVGKDADTTKDQSTKFFNCMFETEVKVIRGGNTLTRTYKIKSIK